MSKCLRVTLFADETFTDERLADQVDALVDQGRFTVERNDQTLSVVVYAEEHAFASCVVWCGVLLGEWKKKARIGEYEIEALNCQFHNPVPLNNYKVKAPDDAFSRSDKRCVVS